MLAAVALMGSLRDLSFERFEALGLERSPDFSLGRCGVFGELKGAFANPYDPFQDRISLVNFSPKLSK
jgi:hypothetical protein